MARRRAGVRARAGTAVRNPANSRAKNAKLAKTQPSALKCEIPDAHASPPRTLVPLGGLGVVARESGAVPARRATARATAKARATATARGEPDQFPSTPRTSMRLAGLAPWRE